MVSAVEQLASNFSLQSFGKATELKQRILFTIGALIVYRLGTFIPIPGIDGAVFRDIFSEQTSGVLGMFNMFAGGAVERMAIFALNIVPYISASIIVQLMTAIVPSLETLKKEGEAGRKKLNQYTRYGTVLLAIIQSYGIAVGLEGLSSAMTGPAVADPGMFFRLSTVIILTGGTLFLVWLGEQMTSRGIGNGTSLIIFTGIVAHLPAVFGQTLESGFSAGFVFAFIAFALAVIVFVVFMERSQRRVIIQTPKRQVSPTAMTGGETTHLPLKLNSAGVIPPIFASSLLLLPTTIAGFQAGGAEPGILTTIAALLGHGQPLYIGLYVLFIVFFAFFYTAVVFNPDDTAENLRKFGGFIPGIRPGQQTADYLDYLLTRLTVLGASYLAIVCVLPEILTAQFGVPFYFGGTSLMIVVTVMMDTIGQLHSHLIAHQYEGLLKRSKVKL